MCYVILCAWIMVWCMNTCGILTILIAPRPCLWWIWFICRNSIPTTNFICIINMRNDTTCRDLCIGVMKNLITKSNVVLGQPLAQNNEDKHGGDGEKSQTMKGHAHIVLVWTLSGLSNRGRWKRATWKGSMLGLNWCSQNISSDWMLDIVWIQLRICFTRPGIFLHNQRFFECWVVWNVKTRMCKNSRQFWDGEIGRSRANCWNLSKYNHVLWAHNRHHQVDWTSRVQI